MDMDIQAAREREMQDRGERRAKQNVQKALDRDEAGDTPAGVQLARRAIEPLSEAIKKFIAESYGGKAGRKSAAARLLKDVDPELAAFITVRAVLAAATRRYTLKSTALTAAERLELELLADAFESKNTALFRAVVRNAEARGMSPARQAKAVELANRHFEVVDKPWTYADRLLVGTKLVELMVATIDIVRVDLVRDGAKRLYHRLSFNEGIEEWFNKYNHAATLTRPLFLPTVVPPKPWEGIRGGAYYSPVLRGGSIVTRPFPGQLEALEKAELGPVYKGLNGLQATPWRVNKRVLAVMEEAWSRGLPLACLPQRDDTPIPEAPPEVTNDVKGGEHRKKWRRKIRGIHEKNAASRSGRFEFARALAVAKENQDHEAIYFPHRLDFRGRAYAASTSLNPQGPDEVKALIEFSKGKPLGDRGLFWLGVHGANLFGNDKISLEDRYSWAARYVDDASRIANDPLNNLDWTEADKPWCFLAWCFEWAGMYAEAGFHGDGTAFISHIPIALDGSCNGIQHFSAMLRDPVGGAAVNLVAADKPSDIYAEVARVVTMKLSDGMATEGPKQWMCDAWFQFGIDRKITKRAVMVLPYGGTYKSCQTYVREAVKDRLDAGQANPFGDELREATELLAGLVWASIGEVVVAAREAMTWLQKCSRVASKAGVPLQWTTPSGFVVRQHYRKKKGGRIETNFFGSFVKFRSTEDGPNLDPVKQASSVAPNFVHALDASALMLTIGRCLDAGIESFAMIHDSYGTHAADTDTLARILRETFVAMYRGHNVLGEFRAEIAQALPPEVAAKLPEVPALGDLDLNQVLKSDYFFA